MGKKARLKKQNREVRQRSGSEKRLPKGIKVGTLDDLTDDVERFFVRLHNQVKHGIKLAVAYGKAEACKTAEEQKMVSSGVSCKNCTASIKGCCYLSVSALLIEGLPAARYLRWKGLDTPDLRKKLHTVGDTMEGMTQEDWFDTRTPCPFFTEDQRCSIYSVRPTACRHHVVFTPPSRCVPAPVGEEAPRTLQFGYGKQVGQVFVWNTQIMESFFGTDLHRSKGVMFGGAFPKVVARILDALDHEDYRAALLEQEWHTVHNPPLMASSVSKSAAQGL